MWAGVSYCKDFAFGLDVLPQKERSNLGEVWEVGEVCHMFGKHFQLKESAGFE